MIGRKPVMETTPGEVSGTQGGPGRGASLRIRQVWLRLRMIGFAYFFSPSSFFFGTSIATRNPKNE